MQYRNTERQKALSDYLLKSLQSSNAGDRTAFGALAKALQGYASGKTRKGLEEQEEINLQLEGQDKNLYRDMLAQQLSGETPQALGDLEVLQGQEMSPELAQRGGTSMSNAQFGTPWGQDAQLENMSAQAAAAAAQRREMEKLQYGRGTQLDVQGLRNEGSLATTNAAGEQARLTQQHGYENAPRTVPAGNVIGRYGSDGFTPDYTNTNFKPPTEAGLGASWGKQTGHMLERRTNAMDAVKLLETNNSARKLLEEGIRTGTLVDFRQGFGRLLTTVGYNEDDVTANTDAFAANMGQAVMGIIKNFGAGTGLSDADREYARQISGGEITINEEAIRKILEINDKAARNVIKNFNRDASAIPKEYQMFPFEIEEPSFDDDGLVKKWLPK